MYSIGVKGNLRIYKERTSIWFFKGTILMFFAS